MLINSRTERYLVPNASHEVINICFHGIGEPGRALEPGEERYWVSADQFLRVLDEVAGWPSVRISFDDGNTSDVTTGLPALRERRLVADFFLVAGRVGRPGSVDAAQARELRRAGMGIGTHGMAHRSWRSLDPQARHHELVVAREKLAEVSGGAVEAAACPLGQYDRRVLSELRRHGYTRVFTSDRRRADPDAWLQPRYSVRRSDTPESLRAEVLARPGLARRIRGRAVGLAKRLR